MGRPSKAESAAIASRRATALRLRIAGVDPLMIGRKLAADPILNSDNAHFEMGYGIARYRDGKPPPSDKALIIRVCQDLAIALEQRRGEVVEAATDMRQLENERLDQYHLAVHQLALGTPGGGGQERRPPDFNALTIALRVMERRAKLNGLDAPTAITNHGGEPLTIEVLPSMLPPAVTPPVPPPAPAGG